MRLMSSPARPWIWRHPDWPALRHDRQVVEADLAEAYRLHGVMEGKALAIGLTSS